MISLRGAQKDQEGRRERDSNPRPLRVTVFKTAAIVHSAIPPEGRSITTGRQGVQASNERGTA